MLMLLLPLAVILCKMLSQHTSTRLLEERQRNACKPFHWVLLLGNVAAVLLLLLLFLHFVE